MPNYHLLIEEWFGDTTSTSNPSAVGITDQVVTNNWYTDNTICLYLPRAISSTPCQYGYGNFPNKSGSEFSYFG